MTKKKDKEMKDKNTKQNLGQFYTTNYDYILNGMKIPSNIKTIIEPFAGNADLLKFIPETDKSKYTFEYYDIDPKQSFITKRDTLFNPPTYENKFILTNPPYLAKNKSKDKVIFAIYDEDDLYKCFMREIINNSSIGGIVIIPLNFWCSIRKNDIKLRQDFLTTYDIIRFNIFEEQVFDDTTYTICSFQFSKKENETENNTESETKSETIEINIFPSKKIINIELNDENNFTIGGEIYNLEQDTSYKIDRLTKKNKKTDEKFITNILVKCIDDNKDSLIGLSIVEDDDRYIDNTYNLSARSYATLVINPELSLDEQKKLVVRFNDFMKEKRELYHSLFLTNYRESNSIARKRISFSLVYEIVNHLIKTR